MTISTSAMAYARLDPAAPTPLRHGSVRVIDGTAEIHNEAGHIVVRHDGAVTRIYASDALRLISAGDVDIEAAGDIRMHAGGRATLVAKAQCIQTEDASACIQLEDGALDIRAERLTARADRSELVSQETHIVSRRIETLAQDLVQRVERLETHATKLIANTVDSYYENSGVWHQRAQRVRTLVSQSFDLITERTSLLSQKETSIDGKKILLG